MDPSFEQALIEVWRQALLENAKTVVLGSEQFLVRRTPNRAADLANMHALGDESTGL